MLIHFQWIPLVILNGKNSFMYLFDWTSMSCFRTWFVNQMHPPPKKIKKLIFYKFVGFILLLLTCIKLLLSPCTITGGLKGFDWGPYLSSGGAEAAPVSYFKHVCIGFRDEFLRILKLSSWRTITLCMTFFSQCPMYDSWHNITTGMKLEVINFECDLSSDAFWIATVIKIGGN